MRLAPGFAGSFYPESPDLLLRQIETFLESVPATAFVASEKLSGGIVPHAGYPYSGQCAAHFYARLAEETPECIVLLGPSHRVAVDGAVAFRLEAFETPLGPVASNMAFVDELERRVAGLHARTPFAEHSLEVQLPFLRRVAPQATVIAIALGMPDLELSRRLGIALAELRASGEELLVLASSDLSHFHRRSIARELDSRFAARVRSLEIDALWADLLDGETEACGAGGVMALLEYAQRRNAEMELLDQRDSADVTRDEDDVVGYLSAALLESVTA